MAALVRRPTNVAFSLLLLLPKIFLLIPNLYQYFGQIITDQQSQEAAQECKEKDKSGCR